MIFLKKNITYRPSRVSSCYYKKNLKKKKNAFGKYRESSL